MAVEEEPSLGRAAEAATLLRRRHRRSCRSPPLRACRSSEKKDGQASSSFGASWAWSAGWLLAPARPRPVPHSSSSGHISSSCLAAPRSCPPRHEAWQASARPAYSTACTVRAARPAARTPRRAAPHAHAQHDVMCMYFMGLIYTTAPHQGRLSRGTSVPSYSVLD